MEFFYLSPEVNKLIDQIPDQIDRNSTAIKARRIFEKDSGAQNPQRFGLKLNETDEDHFFQFASR